MPCIRPCSPSQSNSSCFSFSFQAFFSFLHKNRNFAQFSGGKWKKWVPALTRPLGEYWAENIKMENRAKFKSCIERKQVLGLSIEKTWRILMTTDGCCQNSTKNFPKAALQWAFTKGEPGAGRAQSPHAIVHPVKTDRQKDFFDSDSCSYSESNDKVSCRVHATVISHHIALQIRNFSGISM